ncbi:sodium:proton antiporter [Wielerella bovis]|uniref:sodium:proton antiporter n=1 Tax=Wielerella bovis TaxID=2917790 RepID=UPI002018B097|nr:sodium:proton antiporter [Wielerella bovis]ULJ59358.1 sodium:proton antiporter [Wielerella bovis]ULJ61578.1 sodium:proton antiporter [Wielerella bovis]ULJ63694.1 sodium:proton antiporter [Wielerella bovis]ULJ66129.1 sodium:proton antiporter [Wielerella bovis]ULJ68377.1 sodium:proton antiporter [Wielerella bovis]
MRFKHIALLPLLSLPMFANAADLNGAELSLAWGIPFALILLSIATGPLLFAHTWHHHFGKITAGWTLLFLIPFTIAFGMGQSIHTIAHALVGEYIPFILLLLALYTISGGILVWGNLHGSAKLNTTLLAIGTLLASIMGTTGAAMLLIRPLLRANDNRKHKVHVVVFFIFLVANIGGGLTPLGDPPLFLGFLKGVDFMWTVTHMFLPVLISTIVLLIAFYLLDSHYYKQAGEVLPKDPTPDSKPAAHDFFEEIDGIKIYGKWNFLLLVGVVAAVLMSGIWKPNHAGFDILGTNYALQNLVRDIIFLILTAVSLKITPKQVRAGNDFNFDPIAEVGKLFLGIFITISPVLAILQAGEKGAFASLIALVHDSAGQPINSMYFWMTGLLSAFLDNAPTYLVFFNMAGGDPNVLMRGELFHTLLAISMGSVFMGALSYIGNAPNFMVKAIAEQRNVKMPTFFGYMAWSFGILVPLFILHTLIFFVFKIL